MNSKQQRLLLSFQFFAVCLLPMVARADGDKLNPINQSVLKHVQAVLSLEKQAEERGRRIAVTAIDDAKSQNYSTPSGSKLGARKHPWINGRDPGTSSLDYYIDSYLMTRHDQAEGLNIQNWNQVYGCHEAGLLAYSKDRSLGKVSPSADVPALAAACRAKCPNEAAVLGPTCIANPTIAYQYALWLIGITAPLENTTNQNGYELVEYWFPEYQVSVNDYGLSRLNPVTFPNSGPQFSRQALLGQKAGADSLTMSGLSSEFPMEASGTSEPSVLKEFYGNGSWGGYAAHDFEEKSFAHVYRAWQAWQFSNDKLLSNPKTDGWKAPAINALYTFTDGFPPMTVEHEVTNIWTEWGIWDEITSIPQFSANIPEGSAIMAALFGGNQQIVSSAKQIPPFWQSTGAMSYRAATWPSLYGNLEQVLEVSPNANATLRPVVYRGGYELYPLVTNMSGFASPTLSSQVIFARRALELAGLPSMVQYYPPSSGPIKKIMQYTIDATDPSREIDKLQLIYPRKQVGAQFPARMSEGYANQISECFRSQKIPSMIDQTQDTWAKSNFPADLQGYVMDQQIMGAEGKDVSVAYWNHRIDCSCDICGIGTATTNFNMNGDLPQEPRRFPVCKYAFGKTYSAFVGAGVDTKDYCNIPGAPEEFEQVFQGLNDKVI